MVKILVLFTTYYSLFLQKFISWTDQDQVDFVKTLIRSMCHDQHGQIDAYLKPILQRDFIAFLPGFKRRFL